VIDHLKRKVVEDENENEDVLHFLRIMCNDESFTEFCLCWLKCIESTVLNRMNSHVREQLHLRCTKALCRSHWTHTVQFN